MKPLTKETLQAIPDGTWIMTDRNVTKILDTAPIHCPMPQYGGGYWWRRKNLAEHMRISLTSERDEGTRATNKEKA